MDKNNNEAFQKFLEKIQDQNKADLALQALQVKYEREVSGEDNDKREEQLDKVAVLLEKIEKAITGMSVKVNFEPLQNDIQNQVQILQKSLEEQALIRKISEGSLEYDKDSAQYRNTSGRELTSDVSGKTIKKGGYVDFETAANRLQGQGKRVQEANQLKLTKTPVTGQPGSVQPREEPEPEEEGITSFGNLGDLGKAVGSRVKGIFDFMTNRVQKKDTEPSPGVTGVNPESDNVQSAQEVMADTAKQDIELTKENNNILSEQLKELKKISAALAPATPADLPEGRLKPSPASAEAEEEKGSLLGNALSGAGALAKKAGGALARGAKAAGKGALSIGGGIAKFAGSGAGRMLGAAAAVGLGAYTAYKGYSAAEDSKQSKLDDVQAKVDSGQITTEQAALERKEIGNTATVEKSAAVGEGTGLAGGAIAGGMAGAKLGATIGTFVGGPVGTAIGAGVGTLAGGALGAFAGTKAGKVAGEYAGRGINAAKDFFGGLGDKVKDVYNRGTSGTLAFQNKDEEINKRAKAAGIINDKGEITDFEKYNQINKQVTKEITSKDPTASTLSDVSVASKESLKQGSVTQGGVTTSTSEMKSGISSEKSILGSTTLGSLFSAKGLDVGSFVGQSEKSRVTEGKVEGRDVSSQEQKLGSVMGRRIASGSLFKSDTYKVSGSSGEEMDVSKSDYNKIQKLAKEGKTDEAEKLMASIKSQRDVAPIMSPEESLTPVSPGAKGLALAKDSVENRDLAREATRTTAPTMPIVSSSVNNVNTTSYVPIKASPRPERSSSALDRYNDRIAAY